MQALSYKIRSTMLFYAQIYCKKDEGRRCTKGGDFEWLSSGVWIPILKIQGALELPRVLPAQGGKEIQQAQ